MKRVAPSPKAGLLIAIIGVAMAALSIDALVPRVKLVEALTLFATAFGAGAGFVAALMAWRGK